MQKMIVKEHKHNFYLTIIMIKAIQCRSRSPELLRSTSHVGSTVESCTSGLFTPVLHESHGPRES